MCARRADTTLAVVASRAEQVFRITVRGRFHELTDAARRQLAAAVDEHEIFRSAYTSEGTFVYDARLDFFNLRYEVRVDAGEPEPLALASLLAVHEAEAFLRTMRYGYRELKVTAVDLSALWLDAEQRRN
jgi:Family of unknown function (DUF6204)